MYTRSYFTEDKKIDIPENYDGNAFRENTPGTFTEGDSTLDMEETSAQHTFANKNKEESTESQEALSKKGFSPFFERFPIKKLFSGLPFSLFKTSPCSEDGLSLGTEEILIIIIALYMFFSKDGDKECGIMLALLLFIR